MDPDSQRSRYFTCSVDNGRLYVHEIAGPGGTSHTSYCSREEMDTMFNPSKDRIIHSLEDLEEVLRVSTTLPLPLGMIFVVEELEVEARRRSRTAWTSRASTSADVT